VASASADKNVQLWDAATSGRAARTPGPFRLGLGRRVLAGRSACSVSIMRQDYTALGCDHGRGAMRASGPFRLGASASDGKTVQLWDTTTGAKAITFSPDSRVVLQHRYRAIRPYGYGMELRARYIFR
jgi:WD40 repeat protein